MRMFLRASMSLGLALLAGSTLLGQSGETGLAPLKAAWEKALADAKPTSGMQRYEAVFPSMNRVLGTPPKEKILEYLDLVAASPYSTDEFEETLRCWLLTEAMKREDRALVVRALRTAPPWVLLAGPVEMALVENMGLDGLETIFEALASEPAEWVRTRLLARLCVAFPGLAKKHGVHAAFEKGTFTALGHRRETKSDPEESVIAFVDACRNWIRVNRSSVKLNSKYYIGLNPVTRGMRDKALEPEPPDPDCWLLLPVEAEKIPST